jgi:hypothetical protein
MSFAINTLVLALVTMGVSFAMNRRYRLAASEQGAGYLLTSFAMRAVGAAAFLWVTSMMLR